MDNLFSFDRILPGNPALSVPHACSTTIFSTSVQHFSVPLRFFSALGSKLHKSQP